MRLDRKKFFDGIRGSLFSSLTAETVKGIEDLLDAWEENGTEFVEDLSIILGGVYHETGKRMVPVREGFAKTNQGAINAVTKLFNQKRISKNYALPNKAGVSFYGRGRIQNTWEDNYRKLEKRFNLPFTTNPDLLLDSKIDSLVTVVGHIEGIWTGHKLSQYRKDYRQSRRIVNGLDKADQIAGYIRKFEDAVRKAVIIDSKAPTEAPKDTPATTVPVNKDEPSAGRILTDLLLWLFGGKK